MYAAIDKRKNVRESYLEHLLNMNELTRQEADMIAEVRHSRLSREFELAKTEPFVHDLQTMTGYWAGYYGGNEREDEQVSTSIPRSIASDLIEKACSVPAGFNLHKKLVRQFDDRREMGMGKIPLDWATAESLAFASLLAEGHPVRLSGQDCERGTFSQRHAVVRDTEDNKKYMPLGHLGPNQARIEIINSPLSEAAVLGFEYGYSLDCPEGLILWEAQFGDFANGAQVVIDQFIASGEVKWGRANGLVMMLPHGYEGQGPEHSSARLERFMQLCADTNMQVIQPTTASQIFHVLRRQMIRQFRKPLILFTPKSLLRNKEAASPLSEFTKGGFHTVLGERVESIDAKKVSRLIICSGKVYYDLVKARAEKKIEDVAIIRLEQQYTFPHKALATELKKYPKLEEIIWCQDEPQNQGAWFFVQHNILEGMSDGMKLAYAGRPASASPACGYAHLHQEQQKSLLNAAFAKLKGYVITK
jgi:2-oxoglutarate dehydrogenase E1 component